MAVIKVEHLTKEYKIAKKNKGLAGAVKNLFTQNIYRPALPGTGRSQNGTKAQRKLL